MRRSFGGLSAPRLALALVLAAACLPCRGAGLRGAVGSLLDELAAAYAGEAEPLSKVGVAVLPVADESPLARRYAVGESLRALLEKALARSLVFAPVAPRSVDRFLEDIERALAAGGGTAELPARVVGEVELFLVGSVTQEGEAFRLVLRLVRSDTTEVVAAAEAELPAAAFVAYGEAMFKPFGFAGAYGQAEWDPAAFGGGAYGDFLYSAGVSALFPLTTMFVALEAEALYAQGGQADSPLGAAYGVPAGASGLDTVLGLGGSVRLGVLVPVAYRVYGQVGFSVGLGVDRRRSLFLNEGGDAEPTPRETGFEEYEAYIRFGLEAGAAFRLADSLALELGLGVFGRQFGFMNSSSSRSLEDHLLVPLRIAVGIPF